MSVVETPRFELPTGILTEHEQVLSLVPEAFRGKEYALAHRYLYLVHSSGLTPSEKATIVATAHYLLEFDKDNKRDSGVPAALHKFQVALLLFGEYHSEGLKTQFDYPDITQPHPDTHTITQLQKLASQISVSAHQLALLHDVIEDHKKVKRLAGKAQRQGASEVHREIADLFGHVIADKVYGISHLKSRHATKEEYIFTIVKTLSDDPEIVFVKFLDLFSNVFSLSDLQTRDRGGVTEASRDRIIRKIKEYSMYVPLLLELRHPLSDAICDELLRLQIEYNLMRNPTSARKAFDDAAHYQRQAKGDVEHVYTHFLSELTRTVSIDGHRMEFSGTARAFARRSIHKIDWEHAHAPTFHLHFETVPDMQRALSFIQTYSFDSGESRAHLTEMKTATSNDYVELFVSMHNQYSVRLVLTSPGYRWLFGEFGSALYGNSKEDKQDLSDLKERYTQYLHTFTGSAREDLTRLKEESGRNLIKVYVIDSDSRHHSLWLPRGVSLFDALVRFNLINKVDKSEILSRLSRASTIEGRELHLHSRLFGENVICLSNSAYVFDIDKMKEFYYRGEIKTRSARRIVGDLLRPRRRLYSSRYDPATQGS